MKLGTELDEQLRPDARADLDENGQSPPPTARVKIALLTGGIDKPYVLGLAEALTADGIMLEIIASDELDVPELRDNPRVRFLNLRGDQNPVASLGSKALRVSRYYLRLVHYAAMAEPVVFHILWNNKFELFDRTALLLYYKSLGKKIVFTAHNVNAGKRDLKDSYINRLSLRIQYRICDHIFVHNAKSKSELVSEFRVPESKVTVIPFGINNTVPNTDLSCAEAKQKLGISDGKKVLLFFGRIAPYKGLDYLLKALAALLNSDQAYLLIIAGKPKWDDSYWNKMKAFISDSGITPNVIHEAEFIPDEKVEVFFKAADVLVLPYTNVFQSGVQFLAYSFGLPVVATNVGSLKEQIVEEQTGFVCDPGDAVSLANTIQKYFLSELFRELERRRAGIRSYANELYSWQRVSSLTERVYANLILDAKRKCTTRSRT
jgi:glycosyltransferase involved in cell wall biosynthesis